MSPSPNISGVRFGRLIALERAGDKWGNVIWRCRCDCGNEKFVQIRYLIGGNTKSCGCMKRGPTSGHFHTWRRDGRKGASPTYISWQAMHRRCYGEATKDYLYYGGRGIKVCERWHSFENFLADMGERPEGLTLDRIDGNGDYGPDNCHLATPPQQS